jgi:hypothetical protein
MFLNPLGLKKKAERPRQERHEKDWDVKPKWLDVLKFGSEVALEIVLDDEDAEEIRIAACAENVPGESGEAEGSDGDWVKKTESVAPAFSQERPGKNGAAAEDDGGGAFGKNRQAKEKSEKDEGKPGRP